MSKIIASLSIYFMLNAQQIKERKPRTLEVEIKDWNGSVLMKQLTARQVLEIQKLEDDKIEFVKAVAIQSLVDENLCPIFNKEDAEFLEQQSTSTFTQIVEGFLTVNGLRGEAIEEQKKTY